MSNYLKKFLFTALVFMMPYMNSTSKAMEAEDYEGSTVRARKVILMTDDQKDFASSVNQPTSFQIDSLEDSQDSWTSYLLSPVKSIVKNAYNIVDYTTRNPQKAMIIGICLASQFTIVAANCYCYCSDGGKGRYFKGEFISSFYCSKHCGRDYISCDAFKDL